MSSIIKLVSVNNVEYNANRDPQVYRRKAGDNFSIQARLQGSGTAKAHFEVGGDIKCEKTVSLPGKFDCQVSFDEAGTRIGSLVVEANGSTETRDIRLDVEEYDWIG